MLVFTRRVGETIMIGDEVRVTIVGLKGSQVKVGIQAPRTISVHRQEIQSKSNEITAEALSLETISDCKIK